MSKRGYPEKVIRGQVNTALRSEGKVKEKDGQDINGNGVPLVVTYNPNFKNRRFNLRLLTIFVCRPRNQESFYASTFSLLPKCQELKKVSQQGVKFLSKVKPLPTRNESRLCKI